MMMDLRKSLLAMAFLAFALPGLGQQTLPESPKPQQNVPDAPSASRPVPSLPTVDPNAPPPPGQPAPPPVQQPQPKSEPQKPTGESDVPPPPPMNIKTVPEGGETKVPENDQEQLYKFTVSVNSVTIPVTVKNSDDRMVFGLVKDNFSVYENGEKQQIRFFTSDPLPISAAIVVDVGMPDIALRKVEQTYSALVGAFSEFDEVAVYTYGNTVKQQQDFNAALGERTATTFRQVKDMQGRTGGAAMNQGPMVMGPTVNGRPFDPSMPRNTNTRTMELSRVLNDAILRAAIDLSQRPRNRRKVIFVISDGREDGSTASYEDVKKVLLSNEVILYGVAIDSAAIPGYKQLGKIHLPRQGYGNILPKYASATGGEVFTRFGKEEMERAYSTLMGQARNQYTIGYTAPSTPSTAYRSIEVRVNEPGLKIFAKDGYYPLPPSRK